MNREWVASNLLVAGDVEIRTGNRKGSNPFNWATRCERSHLGSLSAATVEQIRHWSIKNVSFVSLVELKDQRVAREDCKIIGSTEGVRNPEFCYKFFNTAEAKCNAGTCESMRFTRKSNRQCLKQSLCLPFRKSAHDFEAFAHRELSQVSVQPRHLGSDDTGVE